jgi:hypothetical protein
MVPAWRCSSTFPSRSSGILEQCVTGTLDRTVSTNGMTCFFSWLKYLTFLPLRRSKAYCLIYRRQWRPGLETTSTEWTSDNTYKTWSFPASQVSRLKHKTSFGVRCKADTTVFNRQKDVKRKTKVHNACVHMFFLAFWSRVLFCRFGN